MFHRIAAAFIFALWASQCFADGAIATNGSIAEIAINFVSRDDAVIDALRRCNKGTSVSERCEVLVTFKDQCAAIILTRSQPIMFGLGDTAFEATRNAEANCRRDPTTRNCLAFIVKCDSVTFLTATPDPAPAPSTVQPAQPPAPTVTPTPLPPELSPPPKPTLRKIVSDIEELVGDWYSSAIQALMHDEMKLLWRALIVGVLCLIGYGAYKIVHLKMQLSALRKQLPTEVVTSTDSAATEVPTTESMPVQIRPEPTPTSRKEIPSSPKPFEI